MRIRRLLVVGLAAFAVLALSVGAHAVPVLIAHPTVGAGPAAADYNPVFKSWYVANQADDTVSVVTGVGVLDPLAAPAPKRIAVYHEISRVPVGDAPSGVATHDGTGSVYVSSAGSDQVLEILGPRVIATIGGMINPVGVAVDSTNNKLCVAALGENKVWIINTSDRSVAAKVAVNPGPVAVAAGGGFCYVVSYYAGTIQKISLATNAVVGLPALTLPGTFASQPAGIALSSDNALVYVTNQGDGTANPVKVGSLSYIYTSNLAVVFNQSLGAGSNPSGVAASAKQVYVAESGDNEVSTWNPVSPLAAGHLTLPSGVKPTGMAVANDSAILECAAATSYLSESISVYCEA